MADQQFAFYELRSDIKVYLTCVKCDALLTVHHERGMFTGMGMKCPKCGYVVHVEFRRS